MRSASVIVAGDDVFVCSRGTRTNKPLDVLTLESTTYTQFVVYDHVDTNRFSMDMPWSLWTVLALAILNGNCVNWIFFFLRGVDEVISESKGPGHGNEANADVDSASSFGWGWPSQNNLY